MKVLIVDKDFSAREVLKLIISDLGHNVLTAANFLEGKSHLEKHWDIDLLITDFYMSHGNGVGLIQHIKQAHPKIKTIMFTSYKIDELEGAEVADIFLEKPSDLMVLRKRINELAPSAH